MQHFRNKTKFNGLLVLSKTATHIDYKYALAISGKQRPLNFLAVKF